jgi:hypothetical protein
VEGCYYLRSVIAAFCTVRLLDRYDLLLARHNGISSPKFRMFMIDSD